MRFLLPTGIAAIAVGIVLLVCSLAWNQAIPNDVVWSNDQAVEYQEASATFHADTFNKKIDQETLRQSKENWQNQKMELDKAIAWKSHVPFYLRISGLISLGLGICLMLGYRNYE